MKDTFYKLILLCITAFLCIMLLYNRVSYLRQFELITENQHKIMKALNIAEGIDNVDKSHGN